MLRVTRHDVKEGLVRDGCEAGGRGALRIATLRSSAERNGKRSSCTVCLYRWYFVVLFCVLRHLQLLGRDPSQWYSFGNGTVAARLFFRYQWMQQRVRQASRVATTTLKAGL